MPAPSYFAFLRHGEISGMGLSPHGRQQAEGLGQQLARLHLSANKIRIWSSPARRARETAGAAAAWLRQPVIHEEVDLWTGDGPSAGFHGDFQRWIDWLKLELVPKGLLVVVAHLELGALACELPAVFGTQGKPLHTPARGQGMLFTLNTAQPVHQMLVL